MSENITVRSNSLYHKILSLGRDGKIIGAALKKAQVPSHHTEDATQEILLAWCTTGYDDTLSDGEISSYAHTIGWRAALKYRRDLGGPVRLPGSAFRRRPDGSTYVQPGHLAAPLQWHELSEIYADESNPHVETPEQIAVRDQAPIGVVDASFVEVLAERINPKQRLILEMLDRGHSLEQVAGTLGVTVVTVQRNLRQVKAIVQDLKPHDAHAI